MKYLLSLLIPLVCYLLSAFSNATFNISTWQNRDGCTFLMGVTFFISLAWIFGSGEVNKK